MDITRRLALVLIPFALAACGDMTGSEPSLTAPELSTSSDKQQKAWSPTVTVTDLGIRGRANAINARGDVAGFVAVAPGVVHAFVWRRGEFSDLDPNGSFSMANDINSRGQVVGSKDRRAVLWDDGEMIDLGGLGGVGSTALAINDRGQVLVQGNDANGETRIGVWEKGVITELPLPRPIAFDTRGGDISNRGQVVGHKYDQFTDQGAAVMWDRGELIEIGSFSTSWISFANGLNNRGQVVGESDTRLAVRPFFWDGGDMIELGALGDDRTFAGANAINDRGQIVGWSDKPPPTFGQEAVLWWEGRLHPLTVGDRLAEATDINNRGQAVGRATTDFGENRAVMWTIR